MLNRIRAIGDSPIHQRMLKDGFVLKAGGCTSKKYDLSFEYETENYFKYAQRIPGNKTIHVYIPKFILGKREITIFLGKHEYEKPIRRPSCGFDCFLFMEVDRRAQLEDEDMVLQPQAPRRKYTRSPYRKPAKKTTRKRTR